MGSVQVYLPPSKSDTVFLAEIERSDAAVVGIRGLANYRRRRLRRADAANAPCERSSCFCRNRTARRRRAFWSHRRSDRLRGWPSFPHRRRISVFPSLLSASPLGCAKPLCSANPHDIFRAAAGEARDGLLANRARRSDACRRWRSILCRLSSRGPTARPATSFCRCAASGEVRAALAVAGERVTAPDFEIDAANRVIAGSATKIAPPTRSVLADDRMSRPSRRRP